MSSGQVFNIQRYSMHDGEGIRTLVFLKGCPLACLWCSNPESQQIGPQLGFIESKCTGSESCNAPCVPACPVNAALYLTEQGKPCIDRTLCDDCGRCAEACPHDALKVVGREMSVSEVMAEVEKDRIFYRRSGGGVTIGGGEPMLQYDFATQLLRAAQEEYLHTALETCALVSWEHFNKAVQYTDLLYIDLKHIDSQKHKALTGQPNEVILNNLRQVLSLKSAQDVVIRVPVIPGCNDSVDNISQTAKFVAKLGFTQIELMPYHKMGVAKYAQYGMTYSLDELQATGESELQDMRDLVERFFDLKEVSGLY